MEDIYYILEKDTLFWKDNIFLQKETLFWEDNIFCRKTSYFGKADTLYINKSS